MGLRYTPSQSFPELKGLPAQGAHCPLNAWRTWTTLLYRRSRYAPVRTKYRCIMDYFEWSYLIWSNWLSERAYLHKSPQKKVIYIEGFYYSAKRTLPNVRIDTFTVLHWHNNRMYPKFCSLMQSYSNLKPKLLCHWKPCVVPYSESCLSLHYKDNALQKPNNQAHPEIFSWREFYIQKQLRCHRTTLGQSKM